VFKLGRPGSQSDSKASQPETNGSPPEGNGSLPAASTEPGKGGDGSGAAGDASKAGRSKPSKRVLAAGVAAALVVAGGVTYAVTQSASPTQPALAGLPTATGPIHVNFVTPASQATGIDGASPIEINYSEPVAGNSPKPQITPQVPGKWSVEGYAMVFTPTTAFSPSTKVTVRIPSGPDGVRSNGGGLLTSAVTDHFTTGGYTQFGLAELLAEQGYLPMTFAPDSNGGARAENDMATTAAANLSPEGVAYSPAAGSFSWEPGYPSSLASQWTPGQPNVLLRGAVMAFESQHHLTVDGSLTPQFWKALFRAQESGQQNQNGYTYAVANKGSPETLTIYHNGQQVLHSLANTGIPSAPTVDGTFPVFEKFVYTIMSGTNPGGSHYSDPVWWVSYFNGGDAVHYFPRGGYGFQQSLGCVELPWNDARASYPYLTLGSLVTVQG
jgi:L,D-transpeptidase catalytic domain/Bacterial Ig-like domain